MSERRGRLPPQVVWLAVVTAALASLALASSAAALPVLPSSFYGSVKVNGANVADGTVVRALINGQVFAETLTQTYQGQSVYSVDVPGDNPDTTVREGGREGEAVQFTVGGVAAVESGAWHEGINARLDLTASASAPLEPPQAPPRVLPTQTAIRMEVRASPTSAVPVASTLAPTLGAPPQVPDRTGGQAALPSPSGAPGQAVVGSTATERSTSASAPTGALPVALLLVVLAIAIAGAGYLLIRRNK